MITMSIRVQPEVKKMLKPVAARHGLTTAEYARMVLALAASDKLELVLKQKSLAGVKK